MLPTDYTIFQLFELGSQNVRLHISQLNDDINLACKLSPANVFVTLIQKALPGGRHVTKQVKMTKSSSSVNGLLCLAFSPVNKKNYAYSKARSGATVYFLLSGVASNCAAGPITTNQSSRPALLSTNALRRE
jgi:hypothetical protein